MKLLLMCLEFMKTGLFAIGGGLATVPFLYEIAYKYSWFSNTDVLTFIAIAESTPGPIGVNMATYAGFSSAGLSGGILATLSLVLPSVVVILIVAKILDRFKNSRYVQGSFRLLRPASTALIAAAGFNVALAVFFGVEKITIDALGTALSAISNVNWISIVMFAVFFAVLKYIKVHPIFFVLVSAGLGIVLKL